MKRIGPRISIETENFYKANFSSPNAGAEYTLSAVPAVARRFAGYDLKGKFSRGELMLIIDAMNGTMLTAQIAGQHIPLNVQDAIALDGLDEKWEIDGPALIKKLVKMSTPDLMFLEIWVQGFWEQCGSEGEIKIEDYVAAVQKGDPE